MSEIDKSQECKDSDPLVEKSTENSDESQIESKVRIIRIRRKRQRQSPEQSPQNDSQQKDIEELRIRQVFPGFS